MDEASLRKKMVDEQLIPRGISDPRILEVFRAVPRDRFVPEKYRDSAYGDFPLPIGAGQTVSQPYIVAIMTQALGLSGKETVLEIGSGSGYQAAILSRLAKQVYTVERLAALAEQAKNTLAALAYSNIQLKVADGSAGWPEYAPYDGIIVTAASPEIPAPLVEQLKIGGRLIIPIGGALHQILTLVCRGQQGIETTGICDCVFVPLVGQYGWEEGKNV